MNRISRQLLVAISALLTVIWGCDREQGGYRYNTGELPSTPQNLQAFNTIYDDYNSTAPTLGRLIAFCFSSNRNSEGAQFDVVYEPMNVKFDKTTGVLSVKNEYSNWGIHTQDYTAIRQGLNKITSPANELGPYIIHHYLNKGSRFTLLYATDEGGDFDICFISNVSQPGFTSQAPVVYLNSPFNDIYPAFNADTTRLYFCSDRNNGNFDIYYTPLDTLLPDVVMKLSDTTQHPVWSESTLNSPYDDKCPFIFQDLMVFVSNRPGGYGGYDLYYTRWENGAWSAPENFGPTINTVADEYRPIALEEGVSEKQFMMIFSSNRSGSMGGFDLYFTGVNYNLHF